jgi:hypothetical protein
VLVPAGQFTLPGLDDILIYPDDSSPESFYAVSACPRIARTDDQTPEISLLLYGKRLNQSFEPTGGVFSLTVTIGLSKAEEKKALGLLKERLANSTVDPATPAPLPRLLSVHWLTGTCELLIGSKTVAREKPSMFGDNRCSFSISLSADQARLLQQAWHDQLRDLQVRYLVTLQAAPPTSSRAEFGSSETSVRSGEATERHFAYRAKATISTAQTYQLELTGSLSISRSELDSRSSQIEI